MELFVGNRFNMFLKLFSYLLVSFAMLALLNLVIGFSPIADLTREFGLPAWAGGLISWYLDLGTAASVIITLVTSLGSGGLALLAAAGKASLKVFLKKQRDKLGKRAFYAW